MRAGSRASLCIRLLGPLVVDRAGEPIKIGGPRTRVVLVALAHQVGEVVSVDRLAEVLWGDEPPKSARNVIQVQISTLRRALGPGCEIRTEGAGYVLAADELVVDAVEFERGVTEAESLLAHDPAAALAAVGDALAWWRGEPVAHELELTPLRGRLTALHEQRLGGQVVRLDALLRLGRHRECCGEAESLAARHPYREDLRALHMLALYRSGRQTEALAAFRWTRELLVDELGVDPGPELRELHRQILDQDPALDAAPAAVDPPRPSAQALSLTDNLLADPNVFVDRPELDRAITRLAAGRVVTVVGTGGIGKSRCVAAAARRCRGEAIARDGVWLVDLAPLPDDSSDVAAAVAATMGLGHEAGANLTDTITSYLAPRSTLVVLDNCEHVADAARRFVLDVCADAPSTSMLAASRVRLGLVHEAVVTLDRLPDQSARALLAARIAEVGAGPFSEDECDELCAVLDNYPLAIELAAARTRALSPREVATRLARQPELLTASVASPAGSRSHASLVTALDWSLAQLSPAARETLGRATIFVSDFDLESAEDVLSTGGVDAADVVAHLGELVEHHLINRDHGRARFRLLEPIRQHLREREAGPVRRRYVDRFADFATDAAAGLCGPDEARWWDRMHAELPHVREAVRLLVEQRDVERLDRIFGPMAVVVNVLGFVAPGDWAVDALCRLGLDPEEAPGIAIAAAAQYAHLDLLEDCDQIIDRLDAAVDDPWIRAVVLCTRFYRDPMNEDWASQLAAASEGVDPALEVVGSVRAHDSRGLDLADALGNPTLRVFARQWRSARMPDARSDEARQNRQELYRIALESNNQHTIAEGQMFMALQHCHDGDPRRAGPLAAEMIERMVRVRSPQWVWHGVEVVGVMLAMVRREPFTSEQLWAAVSATGRVPFSRVARNPELPQWVASQLTTEQRRDAAASGSAMAMDVAAMEARTAAERMAVG